MDLNTICFGLVGFLFIGYLVLEGFDYGVGMLFPFLGRSDAERQAIIQTLAPVWEGNQVWLIAAGAALFAGFPNAYATLFSGLYLALLLILVTLILRGVAFQFRDKAATPIWRNFWDWALFAGSIIPALLWGVAIGNLLQGLPIDGEKQYAGTLGDLFSAYTIITGFLFVLLFMLHGVNYLALKLDRRLIARIKPAGIKLGKITLGVAALFGLLTYNLAGSDARVITGTALLLAAGAIFFACPRKDDGQIVKNFIFSALAIIASVGAVFLALFPRIVVSNLNPKWSLDIYNSASNPLALESLIFVIGIVLPVILAFEGWKYYIFRQRILVQQEDFEPRRKLWGQLQGLLRELIGYSCKLSVALEKATHTAISEPRREAKDAAQRRVIRLQELKVLTRRGRRRANDKSKTRN